MKKVLLVDDDESFSWSLAKALSECGKDFAIMTAGNGREAVNILEGFPADLVITDLNMPEMDGYEFVSHARESYPAVPILVITGTKTPVVEERLHSLGIYRCIEKPLDVRDMVPLILGELDGTLSDA